jgi:hypothetical protein
MRTPVLWDMPLCLCLGGFADVSKERVSFIVKNSRSMSNLDFANCTDGNKSFFRKLATSFTATQRHASEDPNP